jgi:serine/threonine protein kinase
MLAPETILQNRYRIIRQLGQGGMGTVFEAVDQRLDTTVALKETLFADERLRKQFEREARLLARLHHPALPRVSDHFPEDDGQFLVMQFIAGEDLSELMSRRRGPFPVDQVLTWTDQLLDALDYLHTQEPQIVHRDIKPQNLKLTARGQIILLDFGLAKGQVGELSRVTSTASIFGYTPNYAPLEQIQGLGTDARSDIYALAATVYHLMTGIKPPDALTRAAAIVNGQPDPLVNASEANTAVSAQVSNVLQRAMMQNREQRYASAAEMRRALHDTGPAATATSRTEAATVLFAPTSPVATATQAVPAQATIAKQDTVRGRETTVVRLPGERRRLSRWMVPAGVLLIFGIGLGGFYAFQRNQNPTPMSQTSVTPEGSVPAVSAPSPPAETPTSEAVEEAAIEAEKNAAKAEKSAIKVEKSARAAEKRSSEAAKQETETVIDDGQNKAVVPDEPEVPEPEIPSPGTRPRVRRAGGAVIRTFPDGTQVITAPDGSRVVITPDGRRRIVRRGAKGYRYRVP